MAQEEADRKEAERVAKEEADRKEAERVAQEEADRKEAERVAKEKRKRTRPPTKSQAPVTKKQAVKAWLKYANGQGWVFDQARSKGSYKWFDVKLSDDGSFSSERVYRTTDSLWLLANHPVKIKEARVSICCSQPYVLYTISMAKQLVAQPGLTRGAATS